MKVLGPPPANVRYHRWMWDEEKQEMVKVVIGPNAEGKEQCCVDEEGQKPTPLEVEKDI